MNWLQMPSQSPQIELENYMELPATQETPSVSSSAPREINFKALRNLANLLPACNRCRSRRIKCERKSLECQQCQNADTACVYFDQLLSKKVSSRYVDALQKRLLGLLENQNQIPLPSDLQSTSPSPKPSPEYEGCLGVHSRPTKVTPLDAMAKTSEDHNGSIGRTHQSTIFFGLTSAISQLAELSCCAGLSESDFQPHSESSNHGLVGLARPMLQQHANLPPEATTMTLLSVFNNSINLVCRIIDIDTLRMTCSAPYAGTTCDDMFDVHTLHLVVAISLELLSKRDHSLSISSQAYFQGVVSDPETITSLLQRNNPKSLCVAILLCIYVLFRPRSGDIWRLVGFASRLCVGMVNTPRSNDTEKQTYELLCETLLGIDCDVAIAFGRPSQLAKYHNSPVIDLSPQTPITLAQRLSMHYQSMRRIETRLHDAVMTKYNDRGERIQKIDAIIHSCSEQLEAWRLVWNALFEPDQQSDTAMDLVIPHSKLKVWGDLSYYKTLLLLQRLSTTGTVSASERLLALQAFLQTYRDVYYHAMAATSLALSGTPAASEVYFYPLSWIMAQAVLSAALDLLQLKEHFLGDSQELVFRSCVTLLALLEGNNNNLLHGLTRIIEKLYDSAGELGGGYGASESSLRSG